MAGLAITSLTLSHFRSHLAARLALDGRPVAIFGGNGAGKTNILEAVSLLSPGRGLRRAAPEALARQPEALGWKVAADLATPGSAHRIETWADGAEGRQVRVDGKSSTQIALGRLLRIVWLVPAMDRLWTEGAEGRRQFLDRLTLSFRPDHAEASLVYDRAMRERNRLLRDQAGDATWFGALETRMAEAGAVIIANRAATVARLMAVQSGTKSAFPAADLAMIHPNTADPDTAEALRLALARGRQRDMAAGRTLVGPHRADLTATHALKGIAASQCSTGEQKTLLIALVLGHARALAADHGIPPILLLDEVSAHLDSVHRETLYAEIVALGAQAMMTGTGSDLFAGLDRQAQMFEVTDAAGTSRIVEVGP